MSIDILFHELSSNTDTQLSWIHNAYQDLQIDSIFQYLKSDDSYSDVANEEFLCSIWTDDIKNIVYRNNMILELYQNPKLYKDIQTAINHAKQMIKYWRDRAYTGYSEYMRQLSSTSSYIEALYTLRQALSEPVLKSEGLQHLKRWCDGVYESEKLEMNRQNISRIKSDIPYISSITISVNVDDMLSPTHIMSDINTGESTHTSIFEGDPQNADSLSKTVSFSRGSYGSALQTYIYRNLEASQNGMQKKLRSAIGKLSFTSVNDLEKLCYQWRFYVMAIKMKLKMEERGKPLVAANASNQSAIEAEGLYSVQLELEGISAEPNDFSISGFDIVTGGNQTGKTVFVMTVGQLQWLYQTGFLLPCKSVHMRIVHGIHTLFTTGELAGKTDSRMGFEIQRLKEITDQLGKDSIVFMNEPMTSTSVVEAIDICIAFIKHLASNRICGMMATNYIEIYESALMDKLDKSYLRSLVMQTMEDSNGFCRPNYKVALMPPNYMGVEPIKQKYDLSLTKLIGRLPIGNAELMQKVSQAIQYIKGEVKSNGDSA